MKRLDIYIAGGLLLLVSVYLKSSVVAVSAVMLWGVAVAESVLSKANRDAEITELILRMEKVEKEHKNLSLEITNVSERAKVILGEQF